MIYTVQNNKKLNFVTSLINYIKEKNLYNGDNLIYTNKYTNGTFSIMTPTSEYKNCVFVNGYPHFEVPIEICLEEIYNFISGENIYNYQFNIRYGDTHPHKPIPKLAQVRNLLIENSLSSLIGNNVNSYYGLGDISIKSLKDFSNIFNLDINDEKLFRMIVNNNLSIDIMEKLLSYDKEAVSEIKKFLDYMHISVKDFIFESSLYSNQELYAMLKKEEKYRLYLKQNGELKYTLQELMFIYSILKNEKDILINIIGANQTEHVLEVNNILKNSNQKINCRFLTYEICRNAEERDYQKWAMYLNDFINNNNLNIDGKLLTHDELLKIIITIIGNDTIIDYNNLNKYLKNIRIFCEQLNECNKFSNNNFISSNNDLLCKMALVNYNLNKSIELGNQTFFYKYVISIMREYETNKEKYSFMDNIYYDFIRACFSRLGFSELINKERCKVFVK